MEQVFVKCHHQFTRVRVRNLPEAHDQCLRASRSKSAAQSEYPLAVADVTEAGIAGRENHQLVVAGSEQRHPLQSKDRLPPRAEANLIEPRCLRRPAPGLN